MRSPVTDSFSVFRPRVGSARYVFLALVILVIVAWMRFNNEIATSSKQYFSQFGASVAHETQPEAESPAPPAPAQEPPAAEHPIDTLMQRAEKEYNDLLSKESLDLASAARAYRERRGRHPPPGFDAWFQFAQENKALIVEDFFDQIHHDLNPFWGLDPHQIRQEAKRYQMVISVRNGTATTESDWFWSEIWHSLVQTIESYLPDLDMPLNSMDESRLVVPWEKIGQYMEAEAKSRKILDPAEVIGEYSGVADIDREGNKDLLNTEWDHDHPYFPKARAGCAPDSLARTAEVMTDYSHIPKIRMAHTQPHSYRGYVSNYSLSTSFCHQPDLQGLHGYFIEPLSIAHSTKLMPLFGGSKLVTNNEILLPAPMYWAKDERFKAVDTNEWRRKKDVFVWRGVATGGRNKEDNWQGFHRHRLIAMLNGSLVHKAETWEEIPRNFPMPVDLYDIKATRRGHLGDWLKGVTDAAFMGMNCWPKEDDSDRCKYIGDRIVASQGMTMAEMFHYKYLPDVDGNSFSGRYRSFLESGSLPIKATLFREWHDSRIVAWKHFVPMDNRFQDLYGIMEYFVGYPGFDREDTELNGRKGHDAMAHKIAQDGRDWARRVLRREDMQIYVFRLLLEYARVSDDRRERLGYVGDLA